MAEIIQEEKGKGGGKKKAKKLLPHIDMDTDGRPDDAIDHILYADHSFQ